MAEVVVRVSCGRGRGRLEILEWRGSLGSQTSIRAVALAVHNPNPGSWRSEMVWFWWGTSIFIRCPPRGGHPGAQILLVPAVG